MFEFHGWVNIQCIDDDSESLSETDARQTKLCNEIQVEIDRISWCSGIFRILRGLNGQDHLIITGFANHKQQQVIDFIYWLAERKSDSYGIMHVWDDEDFNHYGRSEIKAICLIKDSVKISIDNALNPFIDIIENIIP